MAISVVQTRVSGGSSGPAIVLGFSGSVTSGNLLVVTGFYQLAGGTIVTIADAVNTYVQTTNSPFTHNSAANHSFCAYAKNVTGGVLTVTVTFSGSSTYSSITIYEISGASLTAPFIIDATGTAASGTSMATGTLALSGATCIIVADYESDASGSGSTTPTPFSGYTQTKTDGLGYTWSSYHNPVSSDEVAGATASGSGIWGILGAAFGNPSTGSIGTITGGATVAGVGSSGAVGTITSAATVAGVGASSATAVGTVTGSSTVSGSSQGTTAAGIATVAAIGAASVASVGVAAGSAVVAAEGSSQGTSLGAAIVAGVGISTATSVGTIIGVSTVTGSALPTGNAIGSASVIGVGASLAQSVGTVTGQATVRGVSKGGVTSVIVPQLRLRRSVLPM